MRRMLSMFGQAFGDERTYAGAQPPDAYLARLLASDTFIALAAVVADDVVGGLARTSCRNSSRRAARSTSTTWPWPSRTGVAASRLT
jgi:hypothetical protein